ncbi:NADH-quinone oxidoreductase subunit A [Fulvivirga maritima]|uniref:NADH-quinone oxidoreductase subunit A n=1 Tax=Fulvivirga maritima TaxID=2904247 RepID=UPI001F2D2CC9|nr:NADH-quinone oxidoreductase subunit A [Fulvivirga maritima]UII28942.1 NADH-quinone oxidoreductase subunit A [Fulvivirga maritima]
MENEQISAFGEVLIFLIGGCVFVLGGLFSSKLIHPHRPNAQKLESYESGEQPIGSGWSRFNIRFYVVALLFLLFEVEIVFVFPWATVFGNADYIEATDGLWGWFSIIEMFVFIFILALGLAYAWVKGYLEWPRANVTPSDFKSPVPEDLYENINKKYQSTKS